MIKVLQVIHGLNMGGAETLVKDYVIGINKTKFDVTVLCYERYNSPYEKLLEQLGIKIIYISDNYPNNYQKKITKRIYALIQRCFLIRRYIRKIRPDILHTHMQVNSYIKFSRPQRSVKIFHTVHNEPHKLWFNGNIRDRMDFRAAKWLVKKYNMRFITLHTSMCKEVNDLFDVNDSIVLNNGIDLGKFENTTKKEEIRTKIKIPVDAFVVGHIGRFSKQKNHEFLIQIFKIICDRMPNAFLLMIGMGDQKKNIESQLNHWKLEGKYIILSNRTDIPDLLKAMDVFVFPSLYEGAPVTLIEAQKIGIPCFISENISRAIKVSNLVNFLPIALGEKKWADVICDYKCPEIKYDGIQEWDIQKVIKKLEKIYEEAILHFQ